MMLTTRRVCLLAALTAILVAVANAADLTIGQSAPVFSDIIGVDDKPHGLADYEDARLVVLAFTCNHCPVAKAYEDRLVALQKEYGSKGVQVLAVNVNNLPADRLDEMKKRAKEKGFNFPYLYDSSQKIGRDYGAKVTPHVFVLDGSRKIAYMGAIDDDMRADKVKKHHLRDALDALLVGKEPPEKATKQFGCSIKYE
ncbi:MAG: thioredoxin family protein [Planctomycetales bacterium]|nr:thioredoxin family protein [Planctomycetales bacterium]